MKRITKKDIKRINTEVSLMDFELFFSVMNTRDIEKANKLSKVYRKEIWKKALRKAKGDIMKAQKILIDEDRKKYINDVENLRKDLWPKAIKKSNGDELKALNIYEKMLKK